MASVLIRTEASPGIGIGHAMRCLALADELAGRGHRSIFVSTDLPDIIIRELGAQNLGYTQLASGLTPIAEQAGLSETLASLAPPVAAVIDGYAFDQTYQAWLKARTELLVCIDDLGVSRFDCHAVLNQNLGFREEDYRDLVSPNTMLFVGPKFSLLRRPYRAAAGKHKVLPEPRKVLITMGGSDPLDRTLKTLRELISMNPIEFDIVLGPGYAHGDPAARLGPHAAGRTHIHRSVLDLSPFILTADLVICPAGSTVWQAACIGTPLITFSVVDNQAAVARGLAEKEAAVVIESDWQDGELRQTVSDLLKDFRRREFLSSRAKQLVDGDGVTRVAGWMDSQLSL